MSDVAELAALGWSAGMIAKELGITRGAAIGRAWRAGLKLGKGPGRGGVCLPRSNAVLAKLTAAERREKERERERKRLAQRDRKAKQLEVKRTIVKPGRIVARCGWQGLF